MILNQRQLSPATGPTRQQWLRPTLTLGVIASLLLALTGCGGNSNGSRANAAPVTPESVEAALSAAEDYLASQKYTNAQVILEKLVERKPDCVEAWETLGQVRYSQSMTATDITPTEDVEKARQDAFECYEKVAALRPDSAGLQHAAGLMAFRAGHDEDAIAHFSKAGMLDSTNVQHPLYEAQVYLKQGKLDLAEHALLRAQAIDPNEPFTLSSLAVVKMQFGDMESAIDLINQARAIDPKSLDLRVQAARIYRRADKARDAIDLLQPLSPMDRNNLAVASELAAAYEAIGDYEHSALTWEHVYNNDPANAQAVCNAADAYLRAGMRMKAKALRDVAHALQPNSAWVQAFDERLGHLPMDASPASP